jgi:hypothetical protein
MGLTEDDRFGMKRVSGMILRNASESRPSSRSGADEKDMKITLLPGNYQVDGWDEA